MISAFVDSSDIEDFVSDLEDMVKKRGQSKPQRERTYGLISENTAEYAQYLDARAGFFVINEEHTSRMVASEIEKLKNVSAPFSDKNIRAALDRAGKKDIKWHKTTIGGVRRGGWRDRTGHLADSYRYEVTD